MRRAVIVKRVNKLSRFRAQLRKGILNTVLKPELVFVYLQVLSIAVLVIWLIWYFGRTEEISAVTEVLGRTPVNANYYLTLAIVGCSFLGVIVTFSIFLFISYINQRNLLKLQRNFLSSVSHELRSPLASMQLWLDTLESRENTPEMTQKIYGMIRSDHERLGRLVEQILVSTRLDLARTNFDQFKEVSVAAFLRKIKSLSRHYTDDMETRIKIECDKNLRLELPIHALHLIMINLVENAAKYSPSGTAIVLKAEIKKKTLFFSVQDRGFGIERRERKKIFNMFHRGDVAEKKAIRGMGLGLFIVRSIVKSLDGNIKVESPGSGIGSIFRVSLPIR